MMLEDPRHIRTPVWLQLTDQQPTQPVRVHLDLDGNECCLIDHADME